MEAEQSFIKEWSDDDDADDEGIIMAEEDEVEENKPVRSMQAVSCSHTTG